MSKEKRSGKNTMNLQIKVALLSYMQDDLIPSFEDLKNAKEILNALEQKYGGKSNTYVQLLLKKFNEMRMREDISVLIMLII